MEITSSYGHWIRRQRKALDLTQQALADRVGYSLAAIKKIEQDERRPSRQIAERLADVLGVPANQREVFLECARGLRSVDQLLLVHEAAIPSSMLPTGTVTFLFTDIEGSTKLAHEHLDTWEIVRAHHHANLRKAIESNKGYVFQIVGDAFRAAFYTAGDAVRAAVKSQVDLQAKNWIETPVRVRMGIHTGKAEVQPDGLYSGFITLSHVQRVMSVGHGGQVLLSSSAQELVQDELPEGLELRDLGEHRLKDFDRPEHLFQLNIAGLPSNFPLLNTLDLHRHNLPVQLTSFIGREREIPEVKYLLSTTRLLTLTGSGGSGKTRLAIHVASDLVDAFKDGVWWVELGTLSDEVLAPQAIAKALEVREIPNQSLRETLVYFLRSKQLLLVLDNCEHLIAACAQLAEQLLRACPNLKILATSREALGLTGESVWYVSTLSVPEPQDEPRVEALMQYEAVHLFVERAVAIKPDFALTEQNARSLTQICRRLDGIPLAIELAAARVKVLTVGQIAARLNDRFDLLTSGSRTALPRQRTLRATIDWSYFLLSEKERTLFCRLSAFVGGWTLEAAEAVCSNDKEGGLQSFEVLDLLTRLVDKSLVIPEDVNGKVRYRRLETIRQYTQEKFLELEDMNTIRDRHLLWYMHLAEKAEPKLEGMEQELWSNILKTEQDNMRAALQWAMKTNGDAALRLAGALGWFWMQGSFLAEGRAWLEEALASNTRALLALRIRAQTFAAGIAVWQGDAVKATSLARALLQVEKSFSDPGESESKLMMIRSLFRVGLAISLGENVPERAVSIFQKARALAENAGDLETAAASLLLEGNIYISESKYEEADKLLKQALSISRAAQTQTISNVVLYCLIGLALVKGNITEAQTYHQMLGRYLTRFNILGELWVFHGTEMEGRLRIAENDFSSAQTLLLESLRTWQEARIIRCIPHGLEACASLALARARFQKAVKLLGASEAVNIPRYPIVRALYEHTLATARTKLDQPIFEKAWTEGQAMTMEQAIEYALSVNAE